MEVVTLTDTLSPEKVSPSLLGGKGYGLYQMAKAGVPVPPAVILTIELYKKYKANPLATMKRIRKEVIPYVTKYLAGEMPDQFMPLVSVRSGAPVSCPGMMDTILNVGLTASNVDAWIDKIGGACVSDSLQRLVTMYGSVVHGIPREEFDNLDAQEAIEFFIAETQQEWPGFEDQLIGSIEAVFKSWDNERAKTYRDLHGIPHDIGTACTIQAMVFGNYNDQSGTGVLFTRDPNSGERVVTGEFLVNAQGEDVVAGIRTPMPLKEMLIWNPSVAVKLDNTVKALEATARDVQDVEFTIQDGNLYILQTRNAKRSARAAIRIAVEMYEEGLISAAEAVKRVTLRQLDQASLPVIDPKCPDLKEGKQNFNGIAAGSGVASGKVVFTAEDAINCKEPCILVTLETNPDDIGGMAKASGVLTMTGGSTSHAAVVARGLNKPCVVGLGLPKEDKEFLPSYKSIFKDQMVTIDGDTGRVWLKKLPVVSPDNDEYMRRFTRMLVGQMPKIPVYNEPVPYKVGLSIVFDMSHYLFRSDYDAKDLMKTVLGMADTVLLNMVPTAPTSSEKAYHDMFIPPERHAEYRKHRAATLLAAIPTPSKYSYKVVADFKVKAPHPTVPVITTLRDLLLMETDGEFFLEMDDDEAVKAVLKLRPALAPLSANSADKYGPAGEQVQKLLS